MMCDTVLTERQKSFIGTTFPTPKGGLLTVVGVDYIQCSQGKTRKRYTTYYKIKCSRCSTDVELFPLCNFKIPENSVLKRAIPCGCSSCYPWNEYQNKIRVKRECVKRGYIFQGWVKRYNGIRTYLKLYNPVSGNTWSSTNLTNFFSGHGDPAKKRLYKKPSSRIHDDTKDINIGKVFKNKGCSSSISIKGCIRVQDSKGYLVKRYIVTCSVCSKDKELWPYGSILVRLGDLKKGQIPCGCASKVFMKPFQRELQITRLCKNEGLEFLRWDTETLTYENTKSSLLWRCKKGHLNSTEFGKFYRDNNRCSTCSKSFSIVNGYMPDKVTEEDHLYLIEVSGKYLKIGRALNIKKRITFIKSKTQANTKDVKVLKIYKDNHQKIYDIEQQLLIIFKYKGYKEDIDWTSEALKLKYKEEILMQLSLTNLNEVV